MASTAKALHIDLPVTLAEVKNLLSIGTLSFEGDLPAPLLHLRHITNDAARSARVREDHGMTRA